MVPMWDDVCVTNPIVAIILQYICIYQIIMLYLLNLHYYLWILSW